MEDNTRLFLSLIRGKFILKCNFDTRKLPVYLSAFYKEFLNAWSILNEAPVITYRDAVHQVIWNNKYVTVQKLSTFKKHLYSKRIITAGNPQSDAGVFLKGAGCRYVSLESFK